MFNRLFSWVFPNSLAHLDGRTVSEVLIKENTLLEKATKSFYDPRVPKLIKFGIRYLILYTRYCILKEYELLPTHRGRLRDVFSPTKTHRKP